MQRRRLDRRIEGSQQADADGQDQCQDQADDGTAEAAVGTG
jgi:hypothetical protein